MRHLFVTICLVVVACCFSGCGQAQTGKTEASAFKWDEKGIRILSVETDGAQVKVGTEEVMKEIGGNFNERMAEKDAQRTTVLMGAMDKGVITDSGGLEANARELGL